MPIKNNLKPKATLTDAEQEAAKFEAERNKNVNRERIGLRIPVQLKEKIYEEAHRTGRGVTDIIVEHMWTRYEE